MSSLRTVLQDADPLRHEAPRLDAERDRVRLTILQATAVGGSRPSDRVRLKRLAAFVAAAIGVAALGYQVWVYRTTQVLAAVRLEVRLAEERPLPGLVVAQVGDSERLIYLHPAIVVGNDEIALSWVVQDGPTRFSVGVQFVASGAERMRQATATHLGRPIAILVDGGVVTAPVVRSPISDSAVISGNYTKAEADRIAKGLGGR